MNLNKRLTEIENRLTPQELPTARVAMIDTEGTVELSYKDETIHFNNVDEMNSFIDEQEIDRKYLLIAELVNPTPDKYKEN